MKNKYYNIYGLYAVEDVNPFYIGITELSLPVRLSNHIYAIKGGSETNERKIMVFEANNFNIEIRLLKQVNTFKTKAFSIEKAYIEKYIDKGCDLVNYREKYVRSKEIEIKNVKISSELLRQVKILSARKGVNIWAFVEEAIKVKLASDSNDLKIA